MTGVIVFTAFTMLGCGRSDSPAVDAVDAVDGTYKRAPMGWNSWNYFRCDDLNETAVLAQAQALVDSGLIDAGYRYVNLDDCWMDGRDADGALRSNQDKFPDEEQVQSDGTIVVVPGMKALAQKIHALHSRKNPELNLLFGLYESPSFFGRTCAGMDGYAGGVGSYLHEEQDAQSFQDWGVDYLKYDSCGSFTASYGVMHDALLKARQRNIDANAADAGERPTQPIFVSADPLALEGFWSGQWYSPLVPFPARTVSNAARVSENVGKSWSTIADSIYYAHANASYVIGPAYFNDLDMLQVGNASDEAYWLDAQKTQFAMWAMFLSPLLAGNDLSSQSSETLEILSNREIIAVNQDLLTLSPALDVPASLAANAANGHSLTEISAQPEGVLQVWKRPLSASGEWAVAMVNGTTSAADISVDPARLGFEGAVTVRDLWTHTQVGNMTGAYTAKAVPPHGTAIFVIKGKERAFDGVISLGSEPIEALVTTSTLDPLKSDGLYRNQAVGGGSLQLGGTSYEQGIAVNALANIVYRLNGRCSTFSSVVGVDDKGRTRLGLAGYAQFEVWGDGIKLWDSGVMKNGDQPLRIDALDIRGVTTLVLHVGDADHGLDGSHADWADATLSCGGG
ncbi:NPCBM/NEW2 domain-containing protein [Solimonas flava]|uniref:NPCBM/NEW2 domain-containing protein n=1 Tax=Solimonas flava TaxID=415849 RepID=UPI00040167E3|nr:NPCBM/NEW2 domain-containing protein [Solimonas flava]